MIPEAVVFDIGNVLIGWAPEAYYDARLGVDARRAMFAETGIEAVNAAIDEGAPFQSSIYALADAHPRWAGEIRQWHDDWAGLTVPVIAHSLVLLRQLRAKGVPVFALTNFGDESFSHAQDIYPFLREFDRFYVSGRLRLVKPAPAIYAAVEADSGIAPDRLLFTDDKAENIAAAAARGWQVHRFEGPEGLADRLVAASLLTHAEAQP